MNLETDLRILIGPNGSGKTTYIGKIKDEYKDKYKKGEYIIFENKNEDLQSLHDGKKSMYLTNTKENDEKILLYVNDENKKAKELINKEININEKNNEIKEKETKNIKKIFTNLNIKIIPNIEINKNIFTSQWILEFNGKKIDIKNAPSGVKKIITLYFEIIDIIDDKDKNKDKSKLLIIEEIENHLHPWWIKICIIILKEIFSKFLKEGDLAILSTHNPEVVVLLKDYWQYFATPADLGNDIKKFDLKEATNEFNKFNENIEKFKDINEEDYIKKIKTRLTFELARFMLNKDSDTILCEGITDQNFISKHSSALVTNASGFHNFDLYISLYMGLYGNINKKLKVIADGDDKLSKDSGQKHIKEKLEKLLGKENVFYFKEDIEQDLFGINEKVKPHKKFEILENNYDKERKNLENEEFWKFLEKEFA